MKIAQVTHLYLPHIGGVEFYVKRVMDSLEKKNIPAEVLTTNMATPANGRKSEAKYFKTTFAFMRNPFSISFIKHMRKNSYDILHLHSVWFLHSLIAVRFRKKAKVVATIHGVYPDDASWKLRFFLKLYKPLVKYILNRSEKVFVYSKIEDEKLKRIFKVPDEKIAIIPMSINIDNYQDKPKEKIILFTGRIIPDKNPDLLLKGVALLNTKFKDYKVVFVGPITNDYKKELTELSTDLGIVNEIKYVGQLDPSIEKEKQELMNYYQTASVFVSVGSWEGQPTRLMEAMQFKTPVIAYAAGGTADFVVENKNGFVIRELNEKLLAEKLEKVLSNEELAKKLGEEARKTIEDGYSWDKAFEKIFEIYKK